MTKKLYRGIICKMEIVKGADILADGQEKARKLYNFARYCAIGYNWKAAQGRGDHFLAGKLPRYATFAGMWEALHDTDEYRALNDRVAGYVIREFDMQMRTWFSGLRGNSLARPPRYAEKFPPLTFEIGKSTGRFSSGTIRLTVLSCSVENRHCYVKVFLPPMTCPERVRSIKILDDGRCVVLYVLDAKKNDSHGVAGIDVGIRNIAALAFDSGDSILYKGGELLSDHRYFQKRIQKCKPSGWIGPGDSRKLPRVGKLPKYYTEWDKHKTSMLHSITDSIVKESLGRGVGTIVVGDLKGICTGKDYGKQTNQKLYTWPFAKLVEMITYKAEEVGISVVKISERNTSKTCSACGFLNKKSARKERGLLTCASCGAELNSDVNGAVNILQKYLREQGALGVAACLPRQPGAAESMPGTGTSNQGSLLASDSGETKRVFASRPTFVARLDLRNFAVELSRC